LRSAVVEVQLETVDAAHATRVVSALRAAGFDVTLPG
jgi:hypothetical protein